MRDKNTVKLDSFLKCTDADIYGKPLTVVPGINGRNARRLMSKGVCICSVAMLMTKMSAIQDEIGFRNWLSRVSGMTREDTKLCYASIKEWCTRRMQRSRARKPDCDDDDEEEEEEEDDC